MTSDPSPRRLLVITYHFPPDGAVGGLRWAGLAKYLARRGWEVHVVTAAAQGSHVAPPGVHVHYQRQFRTLNRLYQDWAHRRRSPQTAAPGERGPVRFEEPPQHSADKLVNRIRRTLGAAVAFPDYARGWILRAALTAQDLQRQMSFDVIVSSGPPQSAHLSGLLACLGRSTAFVADLRDPWAPMHEKKGYQSISDSRWMKATLMFFERTVFQRARRVVVNTPEFAEVLRKTYPGLGVSYVSNGIDPERLPPPAKKFDGLSIAYAGTLYLGRDLSSVVSALKDFIALHPEARDAVKLRVAGTMDTEHEVRFWSDVDAAGLHDSVEVRGQIPTAEALDLINRSHLTLVLAQGQPTQIPAKLYECIAMRVPTLVIGEGQSAASREARRIGALAHEPSDIDGIRGVFERLWSNPGEMKATAPIAYDDIASQMDAVLRATLEDALPNQFDSATAI